MAPYSFYFTVETRKDNDWKFWYNGGVIFSNDKWSTHT